MKLSRGTAPFLALLLATAAYAVENVKVDGEAKLWYQTGVKDNTSLDMFKQESTVGQAVLELGAKADLYDGLKGNARGIVLDSLGLQDDYIKDIPSAGAGYEGGSGYYKTQIWITEANLDYKISNTSIIAGRQVIDTPLLFTERWNASYNTFDAAVVINSDIPKTTLVAGYVAQHNGGAHAGNATATAFPSTTMHGGRFFGFGSSYAGGVVTDGEKGAYLFGAMIKPVDGLAANVWYYDINSILKAYWADAEYKVSNVFVGIQNAGINRALSSADDAMITAGKIGYTIDKLDMDVSYSTTSKGNSGTATIANFATNDKSKVYTQSVFQDGATVGTRDTTAWRVGAGYKFAPVKLSASVQNTKQDTVAATMMKDGTEFDLVAAGKIFNLVNLTGIYIHRDVDMQTATDYKEDAVRLIASVKF